MIDKSLSDKIFLACLDNDLDFLKSKEAGELKKLRDVREATGVHYSVRGGKKSGVDALQYLVKECGCGVTDRSAVGALPIHDACVRGNLEAVKWLVENCSEVSLDSADDSGTLPIHLAVRFNHVDLVKYMVEECHADLNFKTNIGARPLHFAASAGNMDITKFIIEQNKSMVNVQMESGVTPVYLASQEGHIEILQYLVSEAKANTKLLAYDGMSCLHAAAQNGHIAIVQWLINDQKLGINSKDLDSGMTALHFASGAGRTNMVEWLLKNNAKVVKDLHGGTALHTASHYGYADIAKMLLDADCDPDLEDEDGLTATEMAARCAQYGYAGIITKWKKDKAAEEERKKQIALRVLENMKRKIPNKFKIPTVGDIKKMDKWRKIGGIVATEKQNGDIKPQVKEEDKQITEADEDDDDDDDDDDPDYEKAGVMTMMQMIPPPPSYPAPTPPPGGKLERQTRLVSDSDVSPYPTPFGSPIPPSRLNQHRSDAQETLDDGQKENSSDLTDEKENLQTDDVVTEDTKDNELESPKHEAVSTPPPDTGFRALAKFKQSSIKHRNRSPTEASSPDREVAHHMSSEVGEESQLPPMRPMSPREVERLKQDEAVAARDHDVYTERRSMSPKQIDRIKQEEIAGGGVANNSQAIDNESSVELKKSGPGRGSFKALARLSIGSKPSTDEEVFENGTQGTSNTHQEVETSSQASVEPPEDQVNPDQSGFQKNGPGRGSLKALARMSMGAKKSNNDIEENIGKDNSNDATEDSEKQVKTPNKVKVLTRMKSWASSSRSNSEDNINPASQIDENTSTGNMPRPPWKSNLESTEEQNEVKTRTNKNEAPVPAPANKPVEVKAGSNSKFTPSKINTANWEKKDDTSNNLKKDANTGESVRGKVLARWPPAAEDESQNESSSNKHLVAELNDPNIRSSLRKAKKNGKGQSMIFFGAAEATPQNTADTAGNTQQRPTSTMLVGEFDPKNFLEQVPREDTSGNQLPPWKRMLMAKQVAEKAYNDADDTKKQMAIDTKYSEMPLWKREIIRKKEQEKRRSEAMSEAEAK